MTVMTPPDCLQALTALASGHWRLLAGGTDIYPALRDRPLTDPVIDVSSIPDLKKIERVSSGWSFGAAVTWSDIIRAALPPAFGGLKDAAREVGSIQIQNTGTLGGNICNASPAADGVPALLALDAEVEISSLAGKRVLPLSGFITGVRKTALQPGEMVTAVLVPDLSGQSAFLKLGTRRHLVISIISVAAYIELTDGLIRDATLAVGACSPVAVRLSELEDALKNVEARESAISEAIERHHLSVLSPLSDIRASRDYRFEAAAPLIARTILKAAGATP